MLIKAKRECFIQKAKLAKEAPTISSLFFVGHSLLFYRVRSCEVRETKEILEIYCQMSRQLVNLTKSAAYFSKGASQHRSTNLTKLLGIRLMNENKRYPGNPIITSRK